MDEIDSSVMDGWMCGRTGRCVCECMGGCWLIYGAFPKQDLETSVAPSLGWGGVSMGSGLLCVSLRSRQTWGELEQSTQTERAQVCILTADRRPGSWTSPGGRSRCPLRSTLQGKREGRAGLGLLLHGIVLWVLSTETWVSSWGLRTRVVSFHVCWQVWLGKESRMIFGWSLKTPGRAWRTLHPTPQKSGHQSTGPWLFSVMTSDTLAILAQARVCVLCLTMGECCLNSTLLLGSLSLWLVCGIHKHKIVT